MRDLSLAVVGIDYPNQRGPGRRFELQLCTPGEPVELRPEPGNKYDEHAIAVFSCRGVQLGYLPSERAVMIGAQMRHGRSVSAIYQGLGSTCAWVRVAFDGAEPTLPEQGESGQGALVDDSGFWPDEVWEEE